MWEAAPLSLSKVRDWFRMALHGCFRLERRLSSSFLQGHPPSLRFGHPDVTFGRYRLSALGVAGHRAGAAVFSGCALRVSARTLSDAERGEGGASG